MEEDAPRCEDDAQQDNDQWLDEDAEEEGAAEVEGEEEGEELPEEEDDEELPEEDEDEETVADADDDGCPLASASPRRKRSKPRPGLGKCVGELLVEEAELLLGLSGVAR